MAVESESLKGSLSFLRCAECRVEMKGGAPSLRMSAGRCPVCGCGQFTAVFKVTRLPNASAGEVAALLAAGILFGAVGGAIAGAAMPKKTESEFALRKAEGSLLLEKAGLPAAEILEWLVSLARESDKRRLRPDQALCLNCDEIFPKGRPDDPASGYCSLACRNKHQRQREERAGAAKLECPGCGQKVKPRGVPPKCMLCGHALGG